MADQQHSLTVSQANDILAARRALRTSHYMDIGIAGTHELSINVGRLEIALESALRVIAELTGSEVE
jgi:NCAIR mutase (PurE)-related protein